MNLSRRAVWLVAAILLLGVAGLWAGGGYGQVWRYLGLLLLVALLLDGLWARRLPLRLDWHLPAAPWLGRGAHYEVELRQSGVRALTIDLLLPAPTGVAAAPQLHRLQLVSASPQRLQEAFVPQRLGELAWPDAQLRVLGRFGLAWWSRRIAGAATRVVPDALHADERRAAGASDGQAQPQRRGHGLELLGLRDYRPGDPLRALDWKASARSGSLSVRDTVEDQHLELALVLDAGRAGLVQAGALSRLHHAVNLAARFGERAAALGDRLTLVVLCGGVKLSLPGLHGAGGLRRLRSALAGLVAEPRESSPVTGALEVRRLLRNRGLVVWLGDVEGAQADSLVQGGKLLAPKHLPLFVQLLDEDVLAERDREAADWLDPYVSLAAVQTLEQQARAAQRLRQLGCEVVATRPAQAERALLGRYLDLRARRRI